jgi:hypothetical protein
MDLCIQCESANIISNRYGTISAELSDVSIDDLNHHQVYEMIDVDKYVQQIGSDEFLEYISIDQMIEYYGEDEIISRLSTDAILDHFKNNIADHLSK